MKFDTQEQRDAWEVMKPIIDAYRSRGKDFYDALIYAAAEFDRQKATCGIEPLSTEHAALIILDSGYPVAFLIADTLGKLVCPAPKNESRAHAITDRGREVLANLNAMCEVKK